MQSAMNSHQQVFFFQDKDYFEAQKVWEIPNHAANLVKSKAKNTRNQSSIFNEFQTMPNVKLSSLDEAS